MHDEFGDAIRKIHRKHMTKDALEFLALVAFLIFIYLVSK